MSDILYSLTDVDKQYVVAGSTLKILDSLSLEIFKGESVAIVGASGSGKSTLLHLLGCLDSASKGNVFFQNKDLAGLAEAEKAHLRNKEMGFVFQFHHLLPEFSTLENAAMPGLIAGLSRSDAYDKAGLALEKVGLGKRIKHKVTTLSGGERQRVAIARAVLLEPAVLLADEPTGNLDERTGESVGLLLKELNEDFGMTLVVVTHNRELANQMQRCLELRSGKLYYE